MTARRRPVRRIEILRGLWGATCLLAPRAVDRTATGRDPDPTAVTVIRVLGARHLLQASISGLSPTPAVLALGAWTDTVHALTAMALAGLDPRRRRVGMLDAGVAATWAALGRHDERTDSDPGGGRSRREHLAEAVLAHLPARTLAGSR
jgi:hypothetical protein